MPRPLADANVVGDFIVLRIDDGALPKVRWRRSGRTFVTELLDGHRRRLRREFRRACQGVVNGKVVLCHAPGRKPFLEAVPDVLARQGRHAIDGSDCIGHTLRATDPPQRDLADDSVARRLV